MKSTDLFRRINGIETDAVAIVERADGLPGCDKTEVARQVDFFFELRQLIIKLLDLVEIPRGREGAS